METSDPGWKPLRVPHLDERGKRRRPRIITSETEPQDASAQTMYDHLRTVATSSGDLGKRRVGVAQNLWFFAEGASLASVDMSKFDLKKLLATVAVIATIRGEERPAIRAQVKAICGMHESFTTTYAHLDLLDKYPNYKELTLDKLLPQIGGDYADMFYPAPVERGVGTFEDPKMSDWVSMEISPWDDSRVPDLYWEVIERVTHYMPGKDELALTL